MSCASRPLLPRSVDGDLTQNEAQSLAAHLAGCAECRQEQGRLSTLVSLLGQPPPRADEALVGRVMASARSTARPSRTAWRPAIAVVAAAFLIIVGIRFSFSSKDPFVARGSRLQPAQQIGFEAFVHRAAARDQRKALGDGEVVNPGDGFSFTINNVSERSFAYALFAVDARNQVHWFYPAFTSASENPEMPMLEAAAKATRLPDGVVADSPAPGAATLVALFSPAPHTVREIESAIQAGGVGGIGRAFPGAVLQSQPIRFGGK